MMTLPVIRISVTNADPVWYGHLPWTLRRVPLLRVSWTGFSRELTDELRMIQGAWWDSSESCWFVPEDHADLLRSAIQDLLLWPHTEWEVSRW